MDSAKNFRQNPSDTLFHSRPAVDTDIMARLISKPLEKVLGAKIFVENMPGGSTKVGTAECEKAKPDGYTIMQATELTWLGVYFSKASNYKYWETLTPLANIATESYGFYEVRAESPFKTWADLVKYGKENPGKLTCGISSRGVYDLMLDDVAKSYGIQFKHVPFTGAGPGGRPTGGTYRLPFLCGLGGNYHAPCRQDERVGHSDRKATSPDSLCADL